MGNAARGQARLAFRVVLVEYRCSWISQNEKAPQCPQRNYCEEVMQTFERKEEEKERKKENRFICLYKSTWSLVGKYKPPHFLSLSSSTEAAGPAAS